jgi:putative hydrolase of the HAD superfamily
VVGAGARSIADRGRRLDELRADLAARERWEGDLVALLRRIRGAARTAIVSNAWPGTRARIVAAGVADIADEIVVSAEVGCAKPDARIFQIALDRLALRPDEALFIDDTAGHVDAAAALGMLGHVHRDPGSTAAAIASFVATANEADRPSNAGGA